MEKANEFFRKMQDSAKGSINSATLGSIESFDHIKMKAVIKPLINDVNGKPGSLLIEVPVSMVKTDEFFIRVPYKKGDVVLVVFADRDIDRTLLSGGQTTPNSKRVHSLDDAIVVGGIMPFSESLTSEYKDDLLISNDDMTSKIILKEDGDLVIEFDEDIEVKGKNIKLEAEESVEIIGADGVNIDGSGRSEGW